MKTYEIECEHGNYWFEVVEEPGDMIHLRNAFGHFWYEPGDSYLYDVPEGGTSHYLGEVYSYGMVA